MERRTLVPIAIVIVAAAAACGGAPGEANLQSAAGRGTAASASLGPITFTMAPDVPLVQGTSTPYTISLTNTGTSAIPQSNMSANFPGANVTSIPAGCVRFGGGAPSIFCITPSSLEPGATVAFTAQIRPQNVGTVLFNGAAVGNGLAVVSVQDTEEVAPAATDMQVTGSANTGSPAVGSTFTYTFQVKNSGPAATSGGVSFTDALPSSVAFVSLSTTTGSCTGGAVVDCALGDLPVGGQAVIQVSVTAPSSPQAISNTASVALAAQTDRDPRNNAVTVNVASR